MASMGTVAAPTPPSWAHMDEINFQESLLGSYTSTVLRFDVPANEIAVQLSFGEESISLNKNIVQPNLTIVSTNRVEFSRIVDKRHSTSHQAHWCNFSPTEQTHAS